MKRLLIALMVLLLGVGLSTCVRAADPPEPDWLSILTQAALDGDREAGLAAAEAWNADASRTPLDYDELVLLAGFLARETDSRWLTDELRFGLGEVMLNRVASPEFPDSLEEVLRQYEQEPEDGLSSSWEDPESGRVCTELALRLLLGERRMNPRVVYLGPRAVGKIHSRFRDLHYGALYFCESEHPELYDGGIASTVAGIAVRMRRAIS